MSQRDQYHAVADATFREALARRIPLVTTNLVVAEVHRGLLFHAGIQAAAHVLDRIEAAPLVSIEFATPAHHVAARRWLARFGDQRFTYTDAVSFAVMEAVRCTAAVSFDNDFEIAGFSLWRSRGSE